MFESNNVLYNKTNIRYHVFKENSEWQPLLYSIGDNNKKEIIAIKKEGVIIFGIPIFDWFVFEHTFPKLEAIGYYQMEKDIKSILFEKQIFDLIIIHFKTSNPRYYYLEDSVCPSSIV